MEQVLLTKDGELCTPAHEPVRDSLRALSSALVLDERCCLRSFFALLRRHPVLLGISGFLPKALDEAGQCPASGCRAEGIALLVVGKTMELIGFPGEPTAEVYLWLRGLCPAEADSDAPDAEVGPPFSLAALMAADREIRFIPMGQLLDIPLVLSGMKHVVLGDEHKSLYCTTRFTLFEVVDGLAWEFGFQGGSQQCSIGR